LTTCRGWIAAAAGTARRNQPTPAPRAPSRVRRLV